MQGIEDRPHFLSLFSFSVAGIEASTTQELHAFGWDVPHDEGDKVQKGEGHITTQASRCFLIPKAYLLAVIKSQMRHSHGGMAM